MATDCLPSSVLIASLIRYDEFEKSKHSPEAVKAATEEVQGGLGDLPAAC